MFPAPCKAAKLYAVRSTTGQRVAAQRLRRSRFASAQLLQQLIQMIEARIVDDESCRCPCGRAGSAPWCRGAREISSSSRARSRSVFCLRRPAGPRDMRRAPAPRSRAPTGLARRCGWPPRSGAPRRAASSARAWPISSASCHQHRLHRLGQLQQAQQVGRGAARAADRVGRLLVGHAEFVDQALQPGGLLDRIQVLALDVLDQRHRERRARRAPRAPAPALRQARRSAPRASAARRRSVRTGRRPTGRTSSGCIRPCALIEAASSASACSSMRVRGWYLPGRIAPHRQRRHGVLARGCSSPPSSASRPRPSPFGLVHALRPCSDISSVEREVGLRALRSLVPHHRRARRSSALPRGARCAAPACGRPCRRNAAPAAAETCCASVLRGSNMVRSRPAISSRGFRFERTRLIVPTRSESPSSA